MSKKAPRHRGTRIRADSQPIIIDPNGDRQAFPEIAGETNVGVDEDACASVRLLGDYKYGDILSQFPLPQWPITRHDVIFDEQELLRMLRNDFSLGVQEKLAFIRSLGQISHGN